MKLKIGQVLWLRLPFGKTDDVSKAYHPFLVIGSSKSDLEVVDVGQIDSMKNKPWEAFNKGLIPIDINNPHETVLYKPSYLQTDRKIQIEYFDELSHYLDTEETLSQKKLEKIIDSYYDKRYKYGSDNFRDMYFTKEKIEEYNPIDEWNSASLMRKKKYNK